MCFIRNTLYDKIRILKACLLTGLVQRNKLMPFGFNLIFFFGYSFIKNTPDTRICHFNTIKLNQLTLLRINVALLVVYT